MKDRRGEILSPEQYGNTMEAGRIIVTHIATSCDSTLHFVREFPPPPPHTHTKKNNHGLVPDINFEVGEFV